MDAPTARHANHSKINIMPPLVLRTKYAFHTLLWLLGPDVILDVGSMDGSDSKKFKSLVPHSDVIAFEANPDNYQMMCSDNSLAQANIRIIHKLVSNQEGSRSFFVQKPGNSNTSTNKGTSSAIRRNQEGMEIHEVSMDAVRIDSFLRQEYPDKKRVAMWIDVEGHAYEALDSLRNKSNCIQLIHVEVETKEIWPGQRTEHDVLELAKAMGFIPIARGAHAIQRDLILINASWHHTNRIRILIALHIAKWFGPLISKALINRNGAIINHKSA